MTNSALDGSDFGDSSFNDSVTRFKALADPNRLNIVAFLANPMRSCCVQEDGVCACDLETFLGLAQPTVSHHMKLLVQAGLVRAEKRGRWVFYSLEPDAFRELRAFLSPYVLSGAVERR